MSYSDLAQSLRNRLLATVSILAVMASGPALAENVSEASGYWTSAEGRYLFAAGTAQPLLTSGTGPKAQSDRVHNARAYEISGGGPIDESLPGWDFRLAYTRIVSYSHELSAGGITDGTIHLPDGTTLSTTAPESFNSSIQQGFHIGDVDIGTNFTLGGVRTRAFGGARFVDFSQSSRASLLGGEGAVELSCSHYFGGGPRAGASGSYPLAEIGDVMVSLTGEAAGDALFGRSYHKATVTTAGTAALASFNENGNAQGQTAFNADASIGLTLTFLVGGNECAMTAGYRGEGWWQVVDTKVQNFALAGTGGTRGGDQYFHGPFLNLKLLW